MSALGAAWRMRVVLAAAGAFAAAHPPAWCHVVEPPFHGNLAVQVLDITGGVTMTHHYSLGDWSGRWWSIDLTPVGPARDPLLVAGFESLSGLTSQSHLAVMRHTGGGRFATVQVETLGAPGSEVHFVKMFRDGGGVIHLDVFDGLDPGAAQTVHQYLWNGAMFLPAGLRLEPLPAPPEALPRPPPADMRFGANIPFDVSTSSSISGASRVRLIPRSSPPALAVEARPRGGVFATTIGLTAAATDPTAAIHFTITSDGSEPSDPTPASPVLGFSTVWLLPRTFTSTTWIVKLMARAGPLTSDIAREQYVIDASVFADSDSDGLPDIWEAANGFDPLLRDADRDADGDGWTDFDEMRLGSDPNDPLSTGEETRGVRLAGSAMRPDSIAVALAPVDTVAPTGTDLVSSPGMAPAVTDAAGVFTDARTLGEASIVLEVSDPAEPQVVLHRFASDLLWQLPPRAWTDPGFFSDPSVAGNLILLLDPDTWFNQYRDNLMYDIAVGGQVVGAASTAMLQVLEHRIEADLPGVVLANWGIAVETDRDNPPLGNFPSVEDIDLDRNRRLDGFQVGLGLESAGLTGARAQLMDRAGTPLALVGSLLQQAADDPLDATYDALIDFTEDVVRAVSACPGFFDTTDVVLTDFLDLVPLDPVLEDCIDALPALRGRVNRILPPDLPGLARAVNAASGAAAAVLARASARGERAIYERGDLFATGPEYRGLVNSLVGKRAGDEAALADISAGAEAAARAVQEARLLEAAGRTSAVQNLRAGIGVLAAALDAADGATGALATLIARMNGLVYRIDRAGGNPAVLAQLESSAADFLQPDLAAPIVTASPAGPLFTGSVSVRLLSDEPATIYYTLDGSDPAPGGGATLSGSNEIGGIVIDEDRTLSWTAQDFPWGNFSGISRVAWRHDADADAIADVSDNCPADFNPLQENLDGDGLGDLCDPDDDNDLVADGADCRPGDPALWAAPGSLPITVTLPNVVTVQWSSLAPFAGPATFYDFASGDLSLARGRPQPARFDDAVCRINDGAALSSADSAPLAPGAGRYFLVRGENACGTGSYGLDSQGIERLLMVCP